LTWQALRAEIFRTATGIGGQMWARIIIDETNHEGWLIVDQLFDTWDDHGNTVPCHTVRLIQEGNLTIEIRWRSTEPKCSAANIPDWFWPDRNSYVEQPVEWYTGTVLFKNRAGSADGAFCSRRSSEEEDELFKNEERNRKSAPTAETDKFDDSTGIWIDQYTGNFAVDEIIDTGTWTRRCLRTYNPSRGSAYSIIEWQNGEKWKLKPPPMPSDTPFWMRHPDRIYVNPYDPEVLATAVNVELCYWVEETKEVYIDLEVKEILHKVLMRQACEMFRIVGQVTDEENLKAIAALSAKPWFNTQEAAGFANVTERTIRNWIKAKYLTTDEGEKKMLRIKNDEKLSKYIRNVKQTRQPKAV
jgi:hypothetical protein